MYLYNGWDLSLISQLWLISKVYNCRCHFQQMRWKQSQIPQPSQRQQSMRASLHQTSWCLLHSPQATSACWGWQLIRCTSKHQGAKASLLSACACWSSRDHDHHVICPRGVFSCHISSDLSLCMLSSAAISLACDWLPGMLFPGTNLRGYRVSTRPQMARKTSWNAGLVGL